DAACNIIPSVSKTFRSSLGAANRPFAAPGDFVKVNVDPAGCDAASSGIPASPLPNVTVVFTPTGTTARRVVVLAEDCNAIADALAVCKSQAKSSTPIACVSGSAAALSSAAGVLTFRFPDTSALQSPAGLAGPAAIAVTAATDPLPCGLGRAG